MSGQSRRRVTVEQSEPESRQSVFSRLGPGAPNRTEEVLVYQKNTLPFLRLCCTGFLNSLKSA